MHILRTYTPYSLLFYIILSLLFLLQREVELMAEINRLKALLFSISLERDDALAVIENMKAERVALTNEMKRKDEDQHIPPTSFRPYKYIPSYLPAPSDPNSTHTQDGIERITISKTEFETLVAECASQETLITGFQKENEKLLKKVKNRDFEDMNERAKFFDQREYLNKEVNRLRNMVGEIPEDPTVESGIHGDLGSSPGTNSKGPLSLPYARKSAEMLRAELDKDTFVRHLKERAAIAEAGAGVREKELQSVRVCVCVCVSERICKFEYVYMFSFWHDSFVLLTKSSKKPYNNPLPRSQIPHSPTHDNRCF
jgi:hypothetical protein